MTAKVPVIIDGNPTYTSDGPVLSAGDDLVRETEFIQTVGSRAAAIKRNTGNGVRMALYGDSQIGNNFDRGFSALIKTTPFTLDALSVSTGVTGALKIDQGETKAASFAGTEWTNRTGDIATGYTSLGLTTDSDIQKYVPAPFFYVKSQSSSATRICQSAFTDQWGSFYDTENWASTSGVKWRCKVFILDTGSNLPTQYRMRLLYSNTTSSSTNSYTADANFSAANRYPMGDGNYLTELVSETVTNFTNASAPSVFPAALLYESSTGNMNDAETLIFGLVFERIDGDGNPIETGFGFNGLYTAASRNPEVWLGDTEGRVVGAASTRTQHGSERDIRQALWSAQNNPNHFMICFGHNQIVRAYANSTFHGANSAFQRDHFDLMYQIAEDHKNAQGTYPAFEVVIPWATGNMTSVRREETIGNINALNRLGIPAYPVDLYAHHAGDTSNYNGDNVHPNDAAASIALWGPVASTLIPAIASSPVLAGGNRSRDRNRER